MFVKPNENPTYASIKEGEPGHEPGRIALQVFDPARKDFLPPEGREVGGDNDLYWHKRINSNEVSVLTAEEGKKSVEAAEAERARIAAAAEKAKAEEAKKNTAPAPVPVKGKGAGEQQTN
jgi:hypothetical protein